MENDVPYYTETLTFPEQPALDQQLLTRNENGLIYMVVPPESYEANIQVVAHGDELTTGNPLFLTAQDFWSQYVDALDRGYFTEHDFAITGNYNQPPEVDPSLIQSLFPGELDGDSDSDGLDLAIFALALAQGASEADLNADNIVGSQDVEIFSIVFGDIKLD